MGIAMMRKLWGVEKMGRSRAWERMELRVEGGSRVAVEEEEVSK